MRHILLLIVLWFLVTGIFATVADDKVNPKLSSTNLLSSNLKELIALPVSSYSTAKTGTSPVLQLELNLEGQMLLSWTAITGATGYNIYYADVPEPVDPDLWTLLITLSPETLSHLVNPELSREFFYVTAITETPTMPENFIFVEGGTFNNGTSDVTISSFYIDKHELTQAEYQTVMGTNPSHFGNRPDHPVTRASWFNAIEYCNRRSLLEELTPCYSYSIDGTNPDNWPDGWNTASGNHYNISCNWAANGYRLPTEMEWMFAAKGGNSSENYIYSGSDTIGDVAWYSVNSSSTTHTVCTKDANELGIFDMSGNVYEWCWDIHASYPDDSQNNPTGAIYGSDHLLRGGSYLYAQYTCQLTHRKDHLPSTTGNSYGFRVCRGSVR